MRISLQKILTSLFLLAVMYFAAPYYLSTARTSQQSVTVYSSIDKKKIKPLLDIFSKETGIKVDLICGRPEKLSGMMKHGEAIRPADLFIASDVVTLQLLKSEGLLMPFESPVLNVNIDKNFRDPENYWFGLSFTAKILAYSKNRASYKYLNDYDGLSRNEWRGRLLSTSSSNINNRSFLATMIVKNGLEETERWLRDFVMNLSITPDGNDLQQIRNIASGVGDVALISSAEYYYLQASTEGSDKDMLSKVDIIYPNNHFFDEYGGSFINLRAASLINGGENKDNAVRLLMFLSKKEMQEMNIKSNFEFPVNTGTTVPFLDNDLNEMTFYKAALYDLGKYHNEAMRIIDLTGWK